MKLNVEDVNKFMEIVQSCKGPVFLTDWQVDEYEEPNFKLNLKSKISMFIGIAKLLGEYGDWFEIRATNKQDEAKIMKFMVENNQNQ